MKLPGSIGLLLASATSLAVCSVSSLAAQDPPEFAPFVMAGVSGGGDGAWVTGVGLSLRSASGWEWTLDGTKYMTGPLSGRHTTSFGIEGHTRPLIANRVYALFGPRLSWNGPNLGFVLGVGLPVLKPDLKLELKAHAADGINQVSVLVRKSWW